MNIKETYSMGKIQKYPQMLTVRLDGANISIGSQLEWGGHFWSARYANRNIPINNILLDLIKVGDDSHHVAASKNCKKRRMGSTLLIECNDDGYQPATRRMRREAIFWFLFCRLFVFGHRNVDALRLRFDIFYLNLYSSLDTAMLMPWLG